MYQNDIIYQIDTVIYRYMILSRLIHKWLLQITANKSNDSNMLELKFISKVSTMGPDRLFIQIPKEQLKSAKGLKGKYVKVFLQEVTLEE
jgi:hypothetical protein